MPLTIDYDRGKNVAELLFDCFLNDGVHGRIDMPEDTLPDGIAYGSLEHALFITFTVSIDYQRDVHTTRCCALPWGLRIRRLQG